ncbi:GNAT family N-acetyltransferase [Flavobacterium anhuiense]|uniref:GNAT family N-acetyltransferase n=1 Tax=Flavobacterium anhuiense TaxID=459526 RepID=UPI000E6C4466|nr:GNAT family N-acetyltransferase [Flavobacterium anhuiense]URM35324.1 N-acetyltransferase [Flavobacterium anhuiense]
MEIQQINDIKRGYFEAVEDGKEAGKMTYTWAGDSKFIIDHTEVSPDFNGKGVGKKLVMAAVDYARANNLKIIPLCPFAKSVFDKVPEIHDVLFS